MSRARCVSYLLLPLLLLSWLPLASGAAPIVDPTPKAPAAPHPEVVVDGQIDGSYRLVASDPAGDGNGNAVMDLLRLYVAEDADNWYFAFVINADIAATNWGKYVVYVDTTNDANGAPNDAWTRSVTVTDPHKPEYGLYSWVDCASYGPSCTQFWSYGGGAWTQYGTLDGAAMATTGITSTLEWQMARWRLGDPSEMWIEAWSTGGGGSDPAQDTANDPPDDWNAHDWSTPAVILNSTHVVREFFGPALIVTAPPEGARFRQPDIAVTGSVAPAVGVTLTVNLNDTNFYTPPVNPDGSFSQALTLISGTNTITVAAATISGTTEVVRHVFLGSASHDGNVEWYGVNHYTRGLLYHDPFGPITTGSSVTLRLTTYHDDVTSVILRTWDDLGTPQEISYTMHISPTSDPSPVYDYWEVDVPAPAYGTLLWYKFRVEDTPDVDWYEDDDVMNGWGHMVDNPTWSGSFRQVVYEADYTTPDWLQNGVVYQVFPDRFRNGDHANDPIEGTGFIYGDTVITHTVWNEPPVDPRDPGSPYYQRWSADFFGGDLQGVIDELDYLQQLGVTVIYMNPIFRSPSNHKYDTTTYEEVDPAFGDMVTFQALIAAADARGIHVVLDGVFNHTSSDSYYFDHYNRYAETGACESTGSPYGAWYYFTSTPNSCPVCSDGRYYQSWWGYCSLPILNHDDLAVRNYIYGTGAFSGTDGIATYWPRNGSGGWRLDVGGDIDSGYLDNTYWEEFRAALHAVSPDATIIGEEWGDATRWLLGREWDAVMNYQFRAALLSFLRDTPYVDNDANPGSSTGVLNPISPSAFNERLLALIENYPRPALNAMLNLLGSHDTNRVLFVLNPNAAVGDFDPADVAAAKEKLSLGAILMFTLPGAPTIYYGDEAGSYMPSMALSGGGLFEDDPYNRITFPWPDETGSPVFGFDQALYEHYALLAAIRHAHPSLRTGDYVPLLLDDEANAMAYGRVVEGETSVTVVNRAITGQTIAVPVADLLADGTTVEDALNGGQFLVENGAITITVEGLWGAILVPPVECVSPTAAFTYTTAGLEVAFTNESTGTAPLSFLWSFGDGVTSTLVHPVHTYAAAGSYDVSLVVANTCGQDTATATVVVAEGCGPAEAAFSYVTDGLTVTLTNESTGTAPLLFLWDFGDGMTSTLTHPVHAYAAGGSYTVTLEATNACGRDLAWQVVTVVPGCASPVAAFSYAAAGLTVTLTNESTGTAPLLFLWDFGDGVTSTLTHPVHAYAAGGSYTITLEAVNACGRDLAQQVVTVVPGCASPTAAFTYTLVGRVATFSDGSSGTAPLTYLWSFGDGVTSTLANPVHSYARGGVYNVTLVVQNECGMDVAEAMVEVPFVVYLPIVVKG